MDTIGHVPRTPAEVREIAVITDELLESSTVLSPSRNPDGVSAPLENRTLSTVKSEHSMTIGE